jgi:hypothetical protein
MFRSNTVAARNILDIDKDVEKIFERNNEESNSFISDLKSLSGELPANEDIEMNLASGENTVSKKFNSPMEYELEDKRSLTPNQTRREEKEMDLKNRLIADMERRNGKVKKRRRSKGEPKENVLAIRMNKIKRFVNRN